ncbi:unnamed protein product, partial [Discosporangium mesarthrocarpum]
SDARDRLAHFNCVCDSWSLVTSSVEAMDFPVTCDWKGEDGLPRDWIVFLVQHLAAKGVSEYATSWGRRKKRRVAFSSDRPRHGIAGDAPVSDEMREF